MKQKIITFMKNKKIKNSIWIISERVFQALISLILTILTSRYLGPSNYGVLNYGATLVSLFLVIMKLGLDTIVVNELVKNRENEGKILGTSIILRLISGFISIIAMTILVCLLHSDSKLIIITSILQSLVIIVQSINILDYWFQSHLKSKYVSIAKGIAYLIVAIYKIYLLVTGKSVIWFALSTVLDYIVISTFLIIFYKKMGGQKLMFDRNIGKYLLSNSYHFIISGIMVTIYTQIDKLMIGSMINETELGYYSAALTLCSVWVFVPEAILTSVKPSIFQAKKDNSNYLKRLKQTYAIIFWLCVIVALFITIFSKYLILIIYGKEYIAAASVLRILIWYVPFSQLGVARGIWIVSENKNKYSKKYMIWGVIINISLNYILIPYIGIVGATIATIITELFTCFITPLFYKDTRIHTKYLLESIFLKFDNDNDNKIIIKNRK